MNRSHELAEALLARARGDAWVLNELLHKEGAPLWAVGFHAQQAVEKSLKAVLAAHSVEYPRTHNLAMLVDLIEGAGPPAPPDAVDLPRLTPFGTALRCDDELATEAARFPGLAGMRQVVERTLGWAEDLVGRAASGDR